MAIFRERALRDEAARQTELACIEHAAEFHVYELSLEEKLPPGPICPSGDVMTYSH